jgi:hypothetical protein
MNADWSREVNWSKDERIGDESRTSAISRFVHRKILYLNDFLTIRMNICRVASFIGLQRGAWAPVFTGPAGQNGENGLSSTIFQRLAGTIFRDGRYYLRNIVDDRKVEETSHAWYDTARNSHTAPDRCASELGLQ